MCTWFPEGLEDLLDCFHLSNSSIHKICDELDAQLICTGWFHASWPLNVWWPVLMFGVCIDNRLSQPRQHTATANIRVVFGPVWPQHIHLQWWLHILKVIIRDATWCRLQCNQLWNGVFLYTTPVQSAMDDWFEDICHKVSDLLSYGYWLYK